MTLVPLHFWVQKVGLVDYFESVTDDDGNCEKVQLGATEVNICSKQMFTLGECESNELTREKAE